MNAKLLLSGVKETSKVVAPIPLLSIHVASDFEPITRTASTECRSEKEINANIRSTEEKEDRMESCVRLGSEKSMIFKLLNGLIDVWVNRGEMRNSEGKYLKREGELNYFVSVRSDKIILNERILLMVKRRKSGEREERNMVK